MLQNIGLTIFCLIMFSCGNKESVVQMSNDELAIRERRALFNQAIATHDTLRIGNSWMENFLLLTSSDGNITGKHENIESFNRHFKERPDVIYVRTPDQIKVFESWGMASEYGNWEGSWSEGEGKIEIGGTYYAKWHKVDNHWLLRAEIYTPTHCEGGVYCDRLNN